MDRYGKNVLAILLAVALAACGEEDAGDADGGGAAGSGDGQSDGSEPECEQGQVRVEGNCVAPTLPDLGPGWTKMEPGGDTICSRGTPFAYWTRPGTVNKLLVYFQGGGACWNAETCSVGIGSIFKDAVVDADSPADGRGVFELENPDNPFKDWYIVYVPYCTGDIHWGDNTVTYPAVGGSPELTIHHRGFVNGAAVLDWIYENFNAPEFIFTTGCSAGAYASAMFGLYLMDHYRDTGVKGAQLADSGAGVVTPDWFAQSFSQWNVEANLPRWIPYFDETHIEQYTMATAYIAGANFYPDMISAQYNTAHDWNQGFYYIAMGGTQEEWDAKMEQSVQQIAAEAPNFRYYVAWGDMHCIMPADYFYTYQVNGVRFSDWVEDLAAGEEVQNVHCTDCESKELYSP